MWPTGALAVALAELILDAGVSRKADPELHARVRWDDL
jgi:hypothetical protein